MRGIKPLIILALLLLLFGTTNSHLINDLFDGSNWNKKKFASYYQEYDLLDSLFNIAPKIKALEAHQFKINSDTIDEFYKITPTAFLQVYQADSLIKDYGLSDPPPELIGSFSFDGYRSLIVKRYYGAWFITLDYLVYDTNSNLVGYLILAALGGDESYFYEGYGFFEGNNHYKYFEFYKSSDREILSTNSNMICSLKTYRYFIDFVNGTKKELISDQKIDCK